MRRELPLADDLAWISRVRGTLWGLTLLGVVAALGSIPLHAFGAFAIAFVQVTMGTLGFDVLAVRMLRQRLSALVRRKELVRVRGRVVAEADMVYRRTLMDDGTLEEEAVDFSIVDEHGASFDVDVTGARAIAAPDSSLHNGDEVEVFGYPTRVVDATQAALRETPTRTQLGASRDMPVVIVFQPGKRLTPGGNSPSRA